MVKIAVLGDMHIPNRANKIPDEVIAAIENFQPDMIICTGDFVERKVLNLLMEIAPVKYVVGNMDYIDGPHKLKLRIGEFTIGVIHGHGIYPRGDPEQLCEIAREMNVKVLISGHTHIPFVKLHKGILLLNPGSATGAWGGWGGSLKPSMICMTIEGTHMYVKMIEIEYGKFTEKSFRVDKVNGEIKIIQD
ncbi:YfcE family phosphodiesterase [archaeon]|nr:MAG: YfcE family phosphodiesterase [archaeon]RLG64725.1 MAG: YfcE family phosphodiesterase [archaeon]HDM23691.1 YfcE family phosphodiesterase [Candidatus Bathyarchaeota archaeon]